MRFCILRSGSSGNCMLIEQDSTRVLLDAGGMSQKGLQELLEEVNLTFDSISAIVVTHLHRDHINLSALTMCTKHSIPLHIHHENHSVLCRLYNDKSILPLQVIPFCNSPFSIGSLQFEPFTVAHDAQAVTSGFKFYNKIIPDRFVSFASDIGHFPESLVSLFVNAHTIILESNHDLKLLWGNKKRPYLHKKRVADPTGHLSNNQAADALRTIINLSQNPCNRIILCHLSEDNNSPSRAIETITAAIPAENIPSEIFAAPRHERTGYFEI